MTHNVWALVAVKVWFEPMDTAAMICTAHPQSIDAIQDMNLAQWAIMSALPTVAVAPMVFESVVWS
jgi:hypothetical protein